MHRLICHLFQPFLLALFWLLALPPAQAEQTSALEYVQPAQRTAEQWMKAFGAPTSDAPIEISAMIGGKPVRLTWPADQQALAKYPIEVQTTIRRRIELLDTNFSVLRESFIDVAHLLRDRKPSFVTEYEDDMSRVAISIINDPLLPDNSLVRHESFLHNLPNYTQVDLFLPENLVEKTTRRIKELGIPNPIRLHPIAHHLAGDGRDVTTTRWAHDLAILAEDAQRHRMALLPLSYSQGDDLSQPDDDFVWRLKDIEVIRIPLFARAGNLLTAHIHGRNILLIGERELDLLEAYYYNAFLFRPSRTAVIELLQALSRADEVVALPNSEQLFHLDMTLSALRADTIALLKASDPENLPPRSLEVLKQIRHTLTAMGFKIVDIPTTADRIKRFQSPVNVLIYNDLTTGRPTVMVPHFPDPPTWRGPPGQLNRLVDEAYRAAGFRVQPIADLFHQGNGNLHCAVMVLD